MPAQMDTPSSCPRALTSCFLPQALIRPGPIQKAASTETMGRGGDAGVVEKPGVLRRTASSFNNLKSDLNVLRSIWLKPLAGTDHKTRLENFYGGQAGACASHTRFRMCTVRCVPRTV
jgi:hypothetical protein